MSQNLRFLSSICEANHKADWCCFLLACREDAWRLPVTPLAQGAGGQEELQSVQWLKGVIHSLSVTWFFIKKWVVREQLLPLSLSHPLLRSHSIILKDQIWLSVWCLTLVSYSFTRCSKKARKFCCLSFPGKRTCCPCTKPFHCGGGDGKRDILHAWGRVMAVLNSTPPSPQRGF